MTRSSYGDPRVERKLLAILRILAAADAPIGGRNISAALREHGIDLSERAVRYHLRLADERGLTQNLGEQGRVITDKGRMEIDSARASEKLGFIISKIDSLSYRTTFDLEKQQGRIVLNVSLIPQKQFPEALGIMKEVFRAGYCMSELVAVYQSGERVGEVAVPEGMIGFGTVCTVTLNAVLLQQGIPVESKYGGVLEVRGGEPYRFTELVSYSGSTVDPTEMFIVGGRTSVREASITGNGRILASFREVPAVVEGDLDDLFTRYNSLGLGGILAVGRAGQPLLEVPVGLDRIGLTIVAGLTPVAALAEADIPVTNKAMSAIVDYADLMPVWDL
ncbi:MAG: DUF128 domain-containing protein [Armatimonadetes bacterium]|nr:DUF128 domain-containing protein [Armatimonadota bacterium]NIO74583.1 DUF128 domain-containing protein [Armatimonadota bacterium]NIO96536.1 DUF128 domain-containing protein [Armatimonadota bacterium]